MYHLKFVDRTGSVPHRSFMVPCDSFHKEWITVKKGETLEKYSPSIAQTYFPFEDDSRWEAVEEEEVVLLVNMAGAPSSKYIAGELPSYKYIAGRNMILFVMNIHGETIDKTVV